MILCNVGWNIFLGIRGNRIISKIGMILIIIGEVLTQGWIFVWKIWDCLWWIWGVWKLSAGVSICFCSKLSISSDSNFLLMEMNIIMILKTSFIWVFATVCHQQKVIVSGASAKLSVTREKILKSLSRFWNCLLGF